MGVFAVQLGLTAVLVWFLIMAYRKNGLGESEGVAGKIVIYAMYAGLWTLLLGTLFGLVTSPFSFS